MNTRTLVAPLVALALLSGGCLSSPITLGERPAPDAADPDASDRGPGPSPQRPLVDASGTSDAAGTNTGDPGPPPAPTDAALAVDRPVDTLPTDAAGTEDPVVRYQAYLEKRRAQYDRRWVECGGTRLDLLLSAERPIEIRTDVAASLRLGLTLFDQAAGGACVQTLVQATCDRIVEIAGYGGPDDDTGRVPECGSALVGNVAPAGACLSDPDCPPGYDCRHPFDACGSTCQPLPAPGALGSSCEHFTDSCAAGTRCRRTRAEEPMACRPAAQDGDFCAESYDCAPGLHCALKSATAILEGTCRSLRVGTPCAGGWECPFHYVCLGVAPGKRGTCQIGRGAGEPCSIHRLGVNDFRYSECAPLLTCMNPDGRGYRCVDGAKLGERCGEVKDAHGLTWMSCLTGHCARGRAEQSGVCRTRKPAGEQCQGNDDCQAPLTCQIIYRGEPGICSPPPSALPIGSECEFGHGGDGECGPGAYCGLPPGFDPLEPEVPSKGVCTARKRVGEACYRSVDLCEPLAGCVNGVCKRC